MCPMPRQGQLVCQGAAAPNGAPNAMTDIGRDARRIGWQLGKYLNYHQMERGKVEVFS